MWPLRCSSPISLILLAGLAVGLPAIPTPRGEDLYNGKEPLVGRIRGHDDNLPSTVITCANCHSARNATRLSAQPAPEIDHALLSEYRQRHGGPPSRYDLPSFCRVLRTGSDPVYVLIPREMPTYDLTDEQCTSLWNFLNAKGKKDAN